MTKHVARATRQTPSTAIATILEHSAKAGLPIDEILRRSGSGLRVNKRLEEGLCNISPSVLATIGHELLVELQRRTASDGGLAPMEANEFRLLCYAVINCSTLREVIDRMAEFCRMLKGRAGEISCRSEGETTEVFVRRFYTSERWEDFAIDLFSLLTWYKFFGWLIGERLPLMAVQVRYKAFLAKETVSVLFGREIAYAQQDNSLRFPTRFLDARVVQSYPNLVSLLECFPFDFSVPEAEIRSLSERVATIYRNALSRHEAMPALSNIARMIGMSEATIRRRLSVEGTTPDAIKDSCRLERASEYLLQSTMTIDEISRLLGFSGAKTFRKAFGGWTGVSPSTYRQGKITPDKPV